MAAARHHIIIFSLISYLFLSYMVGVSSMKSAENIMAYIIIFHGGLFGNKESESGKSVAASYII